MSLSILEIQVLSYLYEPIGFVYQLHPLRRRQPHPCAQLGRRRQRLVSSLQQNQANGSLKTVDGPAAFDAI